MSSTLDLFSSWWVGAGVGVVAHVASCSMLVCLVVMCLKGLKPATERGPLAVRGCENLQCQDPPCRRPASDSCHPNHPRPKHPAPPFRVVLAGSDGWFYNLSAASQTTLKDIIRDGFLHPKENK